MTVPSFFTFKAILAFVIAQAIVLTLFTWRLPSGTGINNSRSPPLFLLESTSPTTTKRTTVQEPSSLYLHSPQRQSDHIETKATSTLEVSVDIDAHIEQQSDAIIIGSGLAGLVAGLSILDRGGSVVILEKAETMGGNSKKASSGINGISHYQPRGDSVDLFEQDTYRSHGKSSTTTTDTTTIAHPLSESDSRVLMDTIVEHSEAALQWVESRLKVDISQVAQLGGHSHPRTHRPVAGMIGAALVVALSEQLKAYDGDDDHHDHDQDHRVTIITQAHAQKLLTNKEGAVIGVQYVDPRDDNNNNIHSVYAPRTILATGGFAANRELLQKYVPHLAHLPTTSGTWATGDGVTLATQVGASMIDMEHVQIHPTGFIDPDEPASHSKTLAAEVLRGVGGILLNQQGQRFCNELGTRKYISEKMLSMHDDHFYLVLSPLAALAAEKHVDWYHAKNLIQKYNGTTALANWMGVNKAVLVRTLLDYNDDAEQGTDEFNKTLFINGPGATGDLETEIYYAGRVTPVVHYCMGGIAMNTQGQVLKHDRQPVPGLYAAGEVTGGLHGENRLGGNSLLECVVFGQIIGNSTPLSNRAKRNGESLNYDVFPKSNTVTDQAQKVNPSSTRRISMTELKEHSTKYDCWVVIHGRVFDLTEFAEQHPGGARTIQKLAGKDGTKIYNAVHAPDLLDKPQVKVYQVGVLDDVGESATRAEAAGTLLRGGHGITRRISQSELKQHSTKDDCWVVVHDKVLDLTEFAEQHPGGARTIQKLAGKDGTAIYNAVHAPDILDRPQVQAYQVGILADQRSSHDL